MKPVGTERADARWMRAALRLAARGEGRTRPNPPVGAVVVTAGRLVGRGWHRQAGGPHAEVFALAEAGPAARGATLYVTLEPCSTQGRTPACTAAIRQAGIGRVVYGADDPNPRHAGRAARRLRRAGIAVSRHVERAACEEILKPFRKWIRTGLPYVTLKLAMTLDGRIADRTGRSRWITGEPARAFVQDLRQKADAVLVGAGTVRADNPSLLPHTRRPSLVFRVVVAGRGGLPADAVLLTDDAAARTIVAAGACTDRAAKDWSRGGARVWRLPGAGGRVSLRRLMRQLGREGLMHVVCEGGGELAADLLANGLADEGLFFYAPILLGGGGIPGVGGPGWLLSRAPGWTVAEVRPLGRDMLVRVLPESGGA